MLSAIEALSVSSPLELICAFVKLLLQAETLNRTSNRMRDDVHGIPSDVTHDHTGVRRVRPCYGRQRVDGCVIFGGDRVTTLCGTDYGVDAAALRHNAEHV